MTFASHAVPEQGSRFNGYVMQVLSTTILALVGFLVLAAPFSLA